MSVVQKFMVSVSAFAVVMLSSVAAFAQTDGGGSDSKGIIAIAVALGISLAALGGTFGQSRAASAALEGISRNPNAADKVFVPMLLALALIESLVIFTWVLMYLIYSANLA